VKKVRQNCRTFCSHYGFLVVGSLHDQVIDDAMCLVNVMKGAIPKSAHGRIIFFAGDVIVSSVEQFHRAMKAASAVHSCIDGRVIIQVLAVVNCGALNFFDGSINLFNGVLFFFVHVMGGSKVLEMGAGVAEIGECVQVGGMPSRFVGETNCGTESD
jgi:hypothetical protein